MGTFMLIRVIQNDNNPHETGELEASFYAMHPEFKGSINVNWEEDKWTKDDDESGNIVTITLRPENYHSQTKKLTWESDLRRLVQGVNDGKYWKVYVTVY